MINIEQAIIAHHQLLVGTFFSTINLQDGCLAAKSNIPDAMEWEYILPLNNLLPLDTNLYTEELLDSKDYEHQFTDSWLACPLRSELQKNSSKLMHVEVSTLKDMELFLKYFYQAYSGSDPSDPYGAISPTYYDALLNAFQTQQTQLRFFLMSNENKEVIGVSALGIVKPFSFSYCIGIRPPFRKQGLTKHILEYHKHSAQQAGAEFLILQTEQDSFVEQFYLSQGFYQIKALHYYKFNANEDRAFE